MADYSVIPLKSVTPQPWRVYYDRYGKKHRLPADSYSEKHYFELGFTLTMPENPVKSSQPLEDRYMVDTFEGGKHNFDCEVCGESFDSDWRLGCHKRLHTKGRLKKK